MSKVVWIFCFWCVLAVSYFFVGSYMRKCYIRMYEMKGEKQCQLDRGNKEKMQMNYTNIQQIFLSIKYR